VTEPPRPLTVCVAPNSVNTIVVPQVRVVPKPEHLGGAVHLPEGNPSVALALPEEPQGRVSVGVDGRAVTEEDFVVQGQIVYLAVPPLSGTKAMGRISYLVDGALQLLRFELYRVETIAALMESLQIQFDNMTDFLDGVQGIDGDQHDFMYEQARAIQARIVNAMELMPSWSPEEYDDLHARSTELTYTREQA